MPCVVLYEPAQKELIIGVIRINSEKEEYLEGLDHSKRYPHLPQVAVMPRLIIDPIYKLAISTPPTNAKLINGFNRNGNMKIIWNRVLLLYSCGEISSSFR